jgi:hypothetical protein
MIQMAKKKNKPRRRRFSGIDVTKLAEAYLMTSIVTEAMFRTNPIEFLISPKLAGSTTSRIGGDSTWVVSLPEMLKYGLSDSRAYGSLGSVAEVVKSNLGIGGSNRWIMEAGKLLGVGIAFRVGPKLLRRPRAMINRGIKQIGLGTTIRV